MKKKRHYRDKSMERVRDEITDDATENKETVNLRKKRVHYDKKEKGKKRRKKLHVAFH